MQIWIAKDKEKILGKYTVCMFITEPYLVDNLYWGSEKNNCSGRTPFIVDICEQSFVDLKPGEKKLYEIKEVK